MKPINGIEDVEMEIKQALLTLKALPKEGPKRLKAFWPEYADENENAPIKITYLKPLPGEIDDMDIVFEQWMKILDSQERFLVLKRISGCGWKELSYRFNVSRNSLYKRYRKDLEKIFDYVTQHQELPKPVVIDGLKLTNESQGAEYNDFL